MPTFDWELKLWCSVGVVLLLMRFCRTPRMLVLIATGAVAMVRVDEHGAIELAHPAAVELQHRAIDI
jgi:hypothetical protein